MFIANFSAYTVYIFKAISVYYFCIFFTMYWSSTLLYSFQIRLAFTSSIRMIYLFSTVTENLFQCRVKINKCPISIILFRAFIFVKINLKLKFLYLKYNNIPSSSYQPFKAFVYFFQSGNSLTSPIFIWHITPYLYARTLLLLYLWRFLTGFFCGLISHTSTSSTSTSESYFLVLMDFNSYIHHPLQSPTSFSTPIRIRGISF